MPWSSTTLPPVSFGPPFLQLFVDHYHKINQFSKTLAKNATFPKFSWPGKRLQFSQTFPNIWRLYKPCITRIFHMDKTLEAEWMLKTSHSLTTKQKNWRISSTNNCTSFLLFYCKVLKTDRSSNKSVSGEGIAFMFGVSTLQPFAFMEQLMYCPFSSPDTSHQLPLFFYGRFWLICKGVLYFYEQY